MSIYFTGINIYFGKWTPFSSLANFKKLESLRVDAVVLFPSQDNGSKLSQVLPSSLKHLRLLETPGYICDNLDGQNSLLSDFIGNADTVLPDLKYLAVGLPQRFLGQKDIHEEAKSDYHTFQDVALEAEMKKRDFKCKVFCQELGDEERW